MEKPTTYENDDNLKATELSLSLPGSHHKSNKRTQPEKESSPPNKTQVVGWPPVRSYRKNVLQPKKTETDVAGMYVKVSMDGAPYLRKVDLSVYKNYQDLLTGLETMFKCSINEIGDNNGGEYVTTYEDKDEDWMLAGDVPWNMFVSSCKRIRIMKGTEAKGLGSQ